MNFEEEIEKLFNELFHEEDPRKKFERVELLILLIKLAHNLEVPFTYEGKGSLSLAYEHYKNKRYFESVVELRKVKRDLMKSAKKGALG